MMARTIRHPRSNVNVVHPNLEHGHQIDTERIEDASGVLHGCATRRRRRAGARHDHRRGLFSSGEPCRELGSCAPTAIASAYLTRVLVADSRRIRDREDRERLNGPCRFQAALLQIVVTQSAGRQILSSRAQRPQHICRPIRADDCRKLEARNVPLGRS